MPTRDPRVEQMIRYYATRYGVDPNAAVTVADRGEGGVKFGAVGDGGHAFGPFQMNDAGGVLTNRPGNHAAFANSAQGIDYALRGMAQYAKGLTGQQALDAIVRKYERPKDPDAELARIGGAPSGGGAGIAAASAPSPGGIDRRQFANALIGQIGKKVDVNSLVSASRPAAQAASAPMPAMTDAQGRSDGWASLAPGADRAGVATNPAVLAFASQLGQIAGERLVIGTGTNHNQYVKGTRRQSDHWEGNAADIPASGAKLMKLGQAALVAAGMPPAMAAKQTGGLYNIGGYQVIFNSNEGGNHYDHLHVGVRR